MDEIKKGTLVRIIRPGPFGGNDPESRRAAYAEGVDITRGDTAIYLDVDPEGGHRLTKEWNGKTYVYRTMDPSWFVVIEEAA